MTNWVGDFRPGDTVRLAFTTVNTSGVPTQLSGSPTASVYALGFASALAAGVSLAVNFGSFAGQNAVTIDTSQDTVAYVQQQDYAVTISSGNVGGLAGTVVTGYTIGHFSINNRSLRNTTSIAQLGVNVVTIGDATARSSLAAGNVNVVTVGGVVFATSTVAGNVNVVSIAGLGAVSSLALGSVNVSQILGSPVITSSAMVGVNVVTVAGVAPATSGALGNVNVVTIGGALAATSIATGGSVVNQILGAAVVTSAAQLGVNVVAFAGNPTGPKNIDVSTRDIINGTTSNASTTTLVTILTSQVALSTPSQFVGRVLNFTSDTATVNLQGQSTIITGGFTSSGGQLQVTALTDAPARGDAWFIS